MAKPNNLIFIVWMGLTIVSVTCAEVIYVDANSPNDPGTGTVSDPFRRIQDAIDDEDTGSGDIVQIQPGVYTGPGNYNIDPVGRAITIRSEDPNDWAVVANTTIDPNGAGRGFYVHEGEDSDCVISGLTIRNGYSTSDGGAIFCENTSPIIKNCIITNNEAYYGGAVGYWGGSSVIKTCLIINNHGRLGGGVSYYGSVQPAIINCTIVNNTFLYNGGGVFCENSHVTIKNCIIWENENPQIHLESQSDVSISYTDIQGAQEEISNIESTVEWLGGNIDADPNFGSFNPEADSDTWDFHLQSEFGRWGTNSQQWATDLVTSLCIDAGDPNSDHTDEPWPHGGRINMGAYGGTSQASMNGNKADFNIDGVVNLVDFVEFAKRWLSEEACIEDLTGEGQINSADLAIIAYNWLWQSQ
jgi:hypothetical protein